MTSDVNPPDEHAFTSRFATRIHRLECAGSTIDLLAPSDPDALLDDPITHERYAADNYLPYWPIIWPSGLMLAERILTDCDSPPALPAGGGKAIELGCGLGLAGIAAARRGWPMLWTDYDPEAVLFAAHNAQRNGIPAAQIRARHMDWRDPVDEMFDWVIASDVLYERRLHPLLLGAIAALLAPGGVAWVSDPQRSSAEDFPINAVAAGFRVVSSALATTNPTGGSLPGTLFVLTRK
jgi:predicted nicotinamide N-methyase